MRDVTRTPCATIAPMTTEHPTEHPLPYDAAPALEVLLVDLTAAVRELNQTVSGLQALLAPLAATQAATQQVGDQLKTAGQAASQAAGQAAGQVAGVAQLVASAAVKRGVAAGRGLAQRP